MSLLPRYHIHEDQVGYIVRTLAKQFPSFGGGREPENLYARSPITAALKDHPAQFAAGVDIAAVVQSVLTALEIEVES